MINSLDMSGLAPRFVHKRLLRATVGFVTGGPTGAIAGALSGGGRREAAPPIRRQPSRALVPVSRTARPSVASAEEQEEGRFAKFAPAAQPFRRLTGGCIFPTRRDPRTGQCRVFVGTQTGRDDDVIQARPISSGGGPAGEAVMGRFGVAMVPGNRVIDRAVCLPGMKLGKDGLCYDKIANKDRRWPRGRKPLLTGGEMRAISVASRAAGRLTRTAVRLQEIGLIKKPVARKPPKKSGH